MLPWRAVTGQRAFFDRVMGLRPTQGDEKLSFQQPLAMEPPPSPLSSRAKPRDLQFSGPFVEMFFDRAQRFTLTSRAPFLRD